MLMTRIAATLPASGDAATMASRQCKFPCLIRLYAARWKCRAKFRLAYYRIDGLLRLSVPSADATWRDWAVDGYAGIFLICC